MLPTLRTLASAKLAWFRTATQLAPGAVATTHTRTHTDPATGQARTQLITRQPRYIVTNGALATGEVLLKLALANARRVAAVPGSWSALVLTDAGVPELPALYTSGRELAQQRRVTDRTIRTHVAELKACGFISRYKFRGREHAYCVWINPEFVLETPPAAPEAPKMSAENDPISSPKSKNLPVKEVLETTRISKSTITQVEKLVTARGQELAGENWNPLTGTAGLQAGSEAAPQASKSGAGGAGAARAAKYLEKAAAHGTGAREAAAKKVVESFWHYAKTLIYKNQRFNEQAEREAKNAIWFGVFGGFAQGEQADWMGWLPGLQRRVELAAAWLARNPTKWPAAPYAEMQYGRGYFDAGNAQGFAATEAWWRREQATRRQGALERALDAALAELHQRRRLDAGERRVQASKRAKQKTMAELHRYHHTHLRRLAGEEGLVRFAARLQAEHLLHF